MNSSKFLDAYAAIEKWLRAELDVDRSVGFARMVEIACRQSSLVGRYRSDLKEYADLRNAIVHERSDGHVIAEPNDKATARICLLKDLLISPPRVIPEFQKVVQVKEATRPLSEAVVVMHRGSYSQIPIVRDGRVAGVLTANTIARWLGSEAGEDVFSLAETPISKVLKHAEDRENHCFLQRRSTLHEVMEKFESFASRGKELDAILITHNGRSDENLLGILTVSDLPRVMTSLRVVSVNLQRN